MDQYKAANPSALVNPNAELGSAMAINASIDQQVSRQLEQQQKAPQAEALDNRGRLNAAYLVQLPSFARNVVTEAAPNFAEPGDTGKESSSTVAKPQRQTTKQPAAAQVAAPQTIAQEEGVPSAGRSTSTTDQSQQVVQGEFGQSQQSYVNEPANSLQRYQQRLAQQSVQTTGPGGMGGAYGDGQSANLPGFGPNMASQPPNPDAVLAPPAATVPPRGLLIPGQRADCDGRYGGTAVQSHRRARRTVVGRHEPGTFAVWRGRE